MSDLARANVCALTAPNAAYQALNVGTGQATTVRRFAEALTRILGADVDLDLPGKCRAGDIRHCYADVTSAEQLLGFQAEVTLEEGLADLAPWLTNQRPEDLLDHAIDELESHGLAS